jgi:hypothetical protein
MGFMGFIGSIVRPDLLRAARTRDGDRSSTRIYASLAFSLIPGLVSMSRFLTTKTVVVLFD